MFWRKKKVRSEAGQIQIEKTMKVGTIERHRRGYSVSLSDFGLHETGEIDLIYIKLGLPISPEMDELLSPEENIKVSLVIESTRRQLKSV